MDIFVSLIHMTKKLWFKILKKHQNARVGEISLGGVTLTTPIFMPVGTNATIKGVPLEWMSTQYLWTTDPIQIILANTFHLYLRPGADIVKKAWWLHKFEHRDKLILTDSGGFQVFSLWLSKQGKPLVKLFDDRVEFRSPHDGSRHTFTPTGVIDIQRILGSDIMMMLDVCSPVENISKKEVAAHMQITHDRAEIQYQYHMEKYDDYSWVLFPIIQGWLYPDLRAESANVLKNYAPDGIAIWWLSVGESKNEMYHILDELRSHLPEDVPRYLMGVGTPEDIRASIMSGIDMFDCVMPTRLGRHGSAFTQQGTIKIKNQPYKDDFSPLEPSCSCHTCRHFSKAYLHHLCRANEMLWASLLSLHNIAYLHTMIENIKQEILSS